MGVSSAPPKLSSEPRPGCAVEVGLPQDIERGSVVLAPLDSTLALEGSGIAGGRGKMCAPDVT